VNTHIIEGQSRSWFFDAQICVAYAEEVAEIIAAVEKPISRVVITEVHLDHWFGLEVLARGFPVDTNAIDSTLMQPIMKRSCDDGKAVVKLRQTRA
jgi:glyoxylase-like metal-dependent hydrolase (beta-lactamase superfamily II)